MGDALAREMASGRGRDAVIEDQGRQRREQDGRMEQAVITTGQAAAVSDLSKRVGPCENPHTTPSQGSIPGKKRERGQGRNPAEHKSPERKNGHSGESHNNQAARTVYRAPEKYHGCGPKSIKWTGRT